MYDVPATRASLREIQDEAFDVLDQINALLASEQSQSAHTALVHIKFTLTCTLACVTARTRLARARIRALRLLLQNDMIFDRVRQRCVCC